MLCKECCHVCECSTCREHQLSVFWQCCWCWSVGLIGTLFCCLSSCLDVITPWYGSLSKLRGCLSAVIGLPSTESWRCLQEVSSCFCVAYFFKCFGYIWLQLICWFPQVSHEFALNFNPSNPYCQGQFSNKVFLKSEVYGIILIYKLNCGSF